MSEESLPEDDDIVDDLPADEPQAESTYQLSPRSIAIAKGEDPDAIGSEVAEVEGDEVEQEEAPETDSDDSAESSDVTPTSWVTDLDRQQALAYGLDPDDVAAYSSREEFGRVLRAIDKASARRQPSSPDSQIGKNADSAETPAEVDDTKPLDANGKINLAYYKKNFDEDQYAVFETIRKQQDEVERQRTEIQSFREQQEQEAAFRMLADFGRAAEGMRPDFYGRTVDASGLPVVLSQTELDRREKLYQAANVYADFIIRTQESQGLSPSVPPWPQLLKQAEQMAFGEEIAALEKAKAKAEREAKLKKVADQSKRRRPVASSVGDSAAYRNAPPEDPYSTEAIMRHPNVAKVLRGIREGSA